MTQDLKLSEKIGKNLKRLIKQSNFKTQESFASVMNVDPVTVRRWIAYGVKDVNTIFEISNALGVSLEELLKWSSFFDKIIFFI